MIIFQLNPRLPLLLSEDELKLLRVLSVTLIESFKVPLQVVYGPLEGPRPPFHLLNALTDRFEYFQK